MGEKLDIPIYGKEQIENDILNQNGELIPLQITMLRLDELRLMVNELIKRGSSDRYEDTKNISESDGEIIRKAIQNFNYEIRDIKFKKDEMLAFNYRLKKLQSSI